MVDRRGLLRKWPAWLVIGAFAGADLQRIAAAAADDLSWDHDHDHAHIARQRGEILPLEQILSHVRPRLGGEVIGITLRRGQGGWRYVFRVVAPEGQMSEVRVDARSGHMLAPADE